MLTGALPLNSLTIVSILRLQCLVILTNGHNPTSKQATPILLRHMQVIGGWTLM